MKAVATTAGRSARVRNARRRRLVTGCTLAALILAALGLSLAVADPSLKDRIDSAQTNAGQLSNRIDSQTARIVMLTEQAHQAGARAMELAAQVQRAEDRSRELGIQLTAAQQELDRLRAQYAEAVKQLDQRLVAIYESDAPSYADVLLSSHGFDDLSTRADYLQALHDADLKVANRVADLRDQVADHVHQIADLKRSVEAEAAQLAASKQSFEASQAQANAAAAAVASARSHTQASLSDIQGKIDQLEQQQAEQQSAGAPAYEGGPYAIPTYIVMCESGGNYHAYNPSSGAGGAYQILPSTWRAYGGQGAPQNAPKAEQDRIAAMIWRDSGPSAWSCA